ncbi:MAG: SPOR domain-containing protein [Muribaculaceae bacterium]|nr:SPOR domain-containing protein [Muribaculaceae bacterium]
MNTPALRLILGRLLIICVMLGATAAPAAAQEPAEEVAAEEERQPSVAEKIMEESQGNVEIVIDDDLMERIMEPPHGRPITRTQRTSIRNGLNKVKGYRIQVFSDGRNQSTLEARAKQRGSAVAAKFPKYRGQVYTYSSAPNWITRIGNFQTSGEAAAALDELKRAFPSFAGEMRIVNSDIYVIR